MNRGFTLVELLAVIIILSLLAVLVSVSVTKIVRDSKKDLYKTQLTSIKSAAETWGADNPDKLPDNGECKYLTLRDLKEYGLLDSSVKNPKNDKEFSDDLNIKIIGTENKYGKINITYEVDSDDISGCNAVIVEAPVVEKTLDTICTYANNGVAEKTAGAKYTCEVKPGTSYNFYVLTTPQEGDTTINLIMDRNICEDGTPATSQNKCLVAYNSSGDAAGVGPVTAMTYLNNATSSWGNIDNLDLTYDDEGGHFTGFVLNGKARLPYKSEVSSYDSTNKTNAYLYDYLRQSGTIQTNAISGIYGYWILSSYADYSRGAWYVYFSGYVDSGDVVNGSYRGVRAVINLKI